jgi:hypothetical protein
MTVGASVTTQAYNLLGEIIVKQYPIKMLERLF